MHAVLRIVQCYKQIDSNGMISGVEGQVKKIL